MILCLFCHCSRQLHTCLLAPFSSLALTHFCSIFVLFFTPSLFFSLLTRTWLDLSQFFLKATLCSKNSLTTPENLPIFLEGEAMFKKFFNDTSKTPQFFLKGEAMFKKIL